MFAINVILVAKYRKYTRFSVMYNIACLQLNDLLLISALKTGCIDG